MNLVFAAKSDCKMHSPLGKDSHDESSNCILSKPAVLKIVMVVLTIVHNGDGHIRHERAEY